VLGASALGVLFALGWTPCIGPTLATILGLAASSSGATALRGSVLAFTYCLGLGLPFVVAALASEWFVGASGWLRRHALMIGRVGGVLLIAIGVAEMTGWWHDWVLWLQVHVPSTTTWL
jgi:cytochrome c-type biogenesis protein